MFGPTKYIAWAMQFYGKVPFDLASSGIPSVKLHAIGLASPDVDDTSVGAQFERAIARYNDVPVSNVLPAVGTTNAIYLAYAALVSPEDELLVEAPGYEPLTRTAEGLGAHVRTFSRRPEDGFRIDLADVAAKMTPRTRAIVLTTLHNPSGVSTSNSTIVELAKIAEAHGAYVLVDEVYAPFEDLPTADGVFRSSARKLSPNVIAVGSLTKCYGLGMHRVGWVLGPEEIIERARDAGVATFGHLPITHASYGARLLEELAPLAKRGAEIMAGKREIAEAWVATLPDAMWSRPSTGLFGVVTLPGRGDLQARIEEIARDDGVLVAAGSFFGMPESFRLSWASCDRHSFEDGLARLTRLVRR